jgi:hypothetical protein
MMKKNRRSKIDILLKNMKMKLWYIVQNDNEEKWKKWIDIYY